MKDLFTYGTLMCEDIMEEVSGCRVSCAPGTVRGYSRRSVKGEHYPALIPDEGGCVEGVVYMNLPISAWGRLDRFEGEMYLRQRVEVALSNGSTLLAATYVVRPAFFDCLEPSGWDFADFLRKGKECFRKNYKGYDELI
ncbi:MAG: gamma-glutamylcyclotransferase family protein [Thermodesulfobacteriota bacterium]|nr:gamma-glutamylcyclotransferase family protein [Thermodesulfobacteriota bacterium]